MSVVLLMRAVPANGWVTMDLRNPMRSVMPSLHGRVLAVLAGALRGLTGREVARLAEGSQRGVLDALNHLVRGGLVAREDHPPAALFRLNRDHLAAAAVVSLSDLHGALRKQIARTVEEEWKLEPVAVAIFGSAARRDGDESSDIDLLVVRPEHVDASEPWDDQLGQLTRDVARWTGNRLNIVEYGLTELREAAARRVPLVDEFLHDSIKVAGPSVMQMLTTDVAP